MSVIFIVLPAALVVVLAAVVAFLWAARRGQFDDLTTPALRALQEDGPPPAEGPQAVPPSEDLARARGPSGVVPTDVGAHEPRATPGSAGRRRGPAA